ncbi:MAG: hypothetical protein K6F53_08385 [Lachnospiraceae bacterium]|nr:hypothetical protein [Lachnospiraceae bacterium]
MKKTCRIKNRIGFLTILLCAILCAGLFGSAFSVCSFSSGLTNDGAKKTSDGDDEEDEKKKQEEEKKRAKEAALEALNEQYPMIEGEVYIRGTARIGFTLTAEAEIENEDPGSLSYTWIRYEKVRKKIYEDEDGDGEYELVQDEDDEDWEENEEKYEIKEIVIGTDRAYMVQPEDVGCRLCVVVRATNTRGELTASLSEDGNETEYVAKVGDLRAPGPFELESEINVSDDGVVSYIVTIPLAAGCEYSFDGESWSDYNVLNDVRPGSEITGFRRYKSSRFVEQSEAATASLSLESISSEVRTVPNPNGASAATQAAVRNAVKDEQKKKAEEQKAATEEAAEEAKEEKAEEKKAEAAKEAEEKKAEEERLAALKAEKEKSTEEDTEEGPTDEELAAVAADEQLSALTAEEEETLQKEAALFAMEAETAEKAGGFFGTGGPDPQSSLILLIVTSAVFVIGGFAFFMIQNEKDRKKETNEV